LASRTALLRFAVVEDRVREPDDAGAGHELPVDEQAQLPRKEPGPTLGPGEAGEHLRLLQLDRLAIDNHLRGGLLRDVDPRGHDQRPDVQRHRLAR
jgi:hypothetical protein